MKKILMVFVIVSLLTSLSLADNKSTVLDKRKLTEIESVLKSHEINIKVIKGTKVFLKNDKDGYTSSIILATINIDNQKEGVYNLFYKKTKLVKIVWLEQMGRLVGTRTTGEKTIP